MAKVEAITKHVRLWYNNLKGHARMDDTETPAKVADRAKLIISAEEVARRREAVRQADANNRIEGIFRHPDSEAIVEGFVHGEFDIAELVPRLKTHLGLS